MKPILKKIISSVLIFQSKIVLKKYKPTIIAVTGSVGKTSTKDAIFSILSPTLYIRKSEKSFNSEIGIPLTILGCHNGWNDPFIWLQNIFIGLELIFFKSNYPKYLVLEVGADHPGDIQSLTKWLKTDIVVITKIGEVPVHVEAFPSIESLVKEKSYLIDTLKDDGTLILSSDDTKVREMSDGVKQKVMTFGMKSIATVTASDVSVEYDERSLPKGILWKLLYQGESISIKTDGILGEQQVYPLIAGATVGVALGLPIGQIVDGLGEHVPPRGRMNILEGIKGSMLVDDTYNSSPDALREGLNALASLQVSGKRIAVLGDMLELGKYSTEEHKKAGIQAMQSCDILITVGQRAKSMSENAKWFATSGEAGEYVKGIVGEGDVVFVKGSQGVRMEKAVKLLLADTEQAEEVLVRQEEEWLNR